jgi:aspartate 1-decarboxylase
MRRTGMRTMLRSKIHRARVTETNVSYEGSITIDSQLLEAADILPYERVEVLNVNNGARFSTYTIEGKRGSGEICINGAAARLAAKDDIVIILSYESVTNEEVGKVKPIMVYVDSDNEIKSIKHAGDHAENVLVTL